MTGFEEREKGWERKLHQEMEFRFRVAMRRDKELGRWAAEQMGLSGDDVESYVKEVVHADFEEKGDEDVVRKVKADFEAKGIKVDEDKIRATISEMSTHAAKELMGEE